MEYTITLVILLALPGFQCAAISQTGYTSSPDCSSESISRVVTSVFDRTSVRNGVSLYEAQAYLDFATRAAFELDMEDLQRLLLTSLTMYVDQAAFLSDLRRQAELGNISLSADLLSPAKSGPGSRKLFPTETIKDQKRVIGEERLNQLEFSFLLSQAFKNTTQACTRRKRQPLEYERLYLRQTGEFLINKLVIPYWATVPAWWYDGPDYPNMHERCSARLHWETQPRLRRQSYYRAFTDEDLFLLTIASNTLSAYNTPGPHRRSLIELGSAAHQTLEDIRSLALEVIKSGLAGSAGFLWQRGVWADHRDHQYDGCTGDRFPTEGCPRGRETIDDISHSIRWPWWLESLRDAWPPDSPENEYYNQLIVRFTRQFIENDIVFLPEGRVLLNNFLDGWNGWYRVGYEGRKWGYGPFTLSRAGLYGSYFLLSKYEKRVKTYIEALCQMINATDNESIRFRTQYYGLRSAASTGQEGHGEKDDMGPGTLWSINCCLAKRMGLY